MTSATTQQICVAAFHSYCRPTYQPITNQQYQINAVRNEHEDSLIVPPTSKALVTDSMTGLWKEGAGLFQLFQIQVDETLNLTDAQSKFVHLNASDTLNLTDNVTSIKKVIRAVNETLDLVDAQSKKVTHIVAETLGLTDTQIKLVKKAVAETLSLVDTQTKKVSKTVVESLALTDANQKKGSKFVNEILDLIDDAQRVFISGGQLFQRAVNETLDLIDSVSAVFIPAPPPDTATTPGTGRYKLPPAKETKPMARPNFIYRHLIKESLDLKDSVNSIAKHYNLIPRMITQTNIIESLSLIDEVTIKVIRTGRKKILENMKSILELLYSPVAVGAELDRIKVNLSKTNRGAIAIRNQLAEDLEKKLNKITNEYIKDKFMPLDSLKQKHEAEIYGMIRLAVESSYVLAVNYVRKAVRDNTVYLSGTDIEKIKTETQRISDIFWRNAFDYINAKDLENKTKNMPVGFGGFFDTLTNVVKSIVEAASFGTVSKATTTKLQQIPKTDAIDPITNIATVKKRILVFVTKKDEKVCPICVRYEGVEYEEDDPFIVRPIDDTHPNCRCRLLLKDETGIITG